MHIVFKLRTYKYRNALGQSVHTYVLSYDWRETGSIDKKCSAAFLVIYEIDIWRTHDIDDMDMSLCGRGDFHWWMVQEKIKYDIYTYETRKTC